MKENERIRKPETQRHTDEEQARVPARTENGGMIMAIQKQNIQVNKGDDSDENLRVLKEEIYRKLREKGCRITRQREVMLDIILQGDCTSCKEIYQDASRIDPSIGFATVYRLVNLLEDMGVINSKNRFLVAGTQQVKEGGNSTVFLSDHTARNLEWDEWIQVIEEGLRGKGLIEDQTVTAVSFADPQM